MSAPAAHAAEEPQWRLVYEEGPFAIRDYAPTVVAETRVAGERGEAINQGFRRLARFIFGANEPNREIAMTAPVTQRLDGERIAMTAPVAQAASGDGWIVTFYMPPGSQLADMPRPLDDAVLLREEAARRVAVLRFSGLATRDNLDRHAAALRAHIEARGETADGALSYAFYDPPWTLPWARRNEVMIALRR
ncbi:MAG: heme-binding protein [Hyphomonadaceae bacterium JAD_PAG50586_4]|nr:MAG: heme-binding protein [Hyphomonadaceae bacterium JAD_PAG50586_4]